MKNRTKNLAKMILETIPLLMGYIRMEMREHRQPDLSLSQFRTLLFCRRQPGSSLSALASHHGLTLASTSRMVDSLVKRGLLNRKPDKGDRRQIELYLSPQGADLLARAEKATLLNLEEKLKQLTPLQIQKIEESLVLLGQVFNISEKHRDLNLNRNKKNKKIKSGRQIYEYC